MSAFPTETKGPTLPCEHDFDNPERRGGAHYLCPRCWEDITLLLVLMEESLGEDDE